MVRVLTVVVVVICYGYALCLSMLFFFFFKQKTAYEMCGRDWSSDVCSSDLIGSTENAAQFACGILLAIDSLHSCVFVYE